MSTDDRPLADRLQQTDEQPDASSVHTPDQLRRIASLQRWLMRTIAAMIALVVLFVVALVAAIQRMNAPSPAADALGQGAMLALFALIPGQLVLFVLLGRAVGKGWLTILFGLVVAILCGLSTRIVYLICLLWVSSAATEALKAAGIRVGFLGARPADVEAAIAVRELPQHAIGAATD